MYKRSTCLMNIDMFFVSSYYSYMSRNLYQIQIQISLFPIKDPFRAEQLTKNLIQ